MKTLLLCPLILTVSLVFSQNSIIEGNSALGSGLWSENVSGYSHCDALSIGLSVENRWLLPELAHSTLAVAVPTHYGCIAMTLSTIGDQILNKNELTLSLARDFSSTFSMGLRTRYSLSQIDHQTKGWIEADIGTQIHLSNAVSVAFQLLNPLGTHTTKSNRNWLGLLGIRQSRFNAVGQKRNHIAHLLDSLSQL